MKNLVFASILAAIAPIAFADITINEPWARATVPGQPVGAVYMKISSPAAVSLVDVQTDVAKDVQVHTMKMENGVMKMRDHGQLEVPAGQTVELAPGGVHLMLLGLKKPLVAGEPVTVKMTFQDAKNTRSTSTVTVPIRAIGK
ncbi:copper chaperone PCu(A)C [Noviherbaspirillum cavernae]|uniref:Copper chaperone PCu(A)C n=1 Tax=Noviherbaspirillum cavernae TaxID=2320862 RepID=A0A418X4G3_9BURK|nr:copper chaperone PCu(A)C [Noviherbaspirillum cavernae]RJG07367.1 copper chaperone PCu(A)C [Noviherbaspirillum cavernae]